jgi:nickel-dependent lactate racemase
MATPLNKTIPDQWESQILARILRHNRVIFVTRPEMERIVREMKMDYAATLDAALDMARADKGLNASISVIPYGVSVIVTRK